MSSGGGVEVEANFKRTRRWVERRRARQGAARHSLQASDLRKITISKHREVR